MKREEAKELFRSDIDAYGKPRHIMKNIDKIYDEFEAEHPLPPAEGAEEFLKQNHISGADFVYTTGFKNMVDLVTEFATLHAQRLAEKMVSERLKEDTYMTCDVCGCHPSVIITTSFGRFCQQHAKYI